MLGSLPIWFRLEMIRLRLQLYVFFAEGRRQMLADVMVSAPLVDARLDRCFGPDRNVKMDLSLLTCSVVRLIIKHEVSLHAILREIVPEVGQTLLDVLLRRGTSTVRPGRT